MGVVSTVWLFGYVLGSLSSNCEGSLKLYADLLRGAQKLACGIGQLTATDCISKSEVNSFMEIVNIIAKFEINRYIS